MTRMPLAALRWRELPGGPVLELLDQTALPSTERLVVCQDADELVNAITALVIRGAPLLGVAGAYGVALAAARSSGADGAETVGRAARRLAAARPTAVNLARGVAHAHTAYLAAAGHESGAAAALAAAEEVAAADRAASAAIAGHGLTLVPPRARILTHCNTGALVSAGAGTAFAVIAAAHAAGRLAQLWIDETRPLLQGARLTAYEASRAGMPHAILVDGAAASLFAAGRVDLVLVGADRIAADGSVANKVGTYGLAVLARHHDVPFVVVAPRSTIDADTPTGDAITIEQRAPQEVTQPWGFACAPAGSAAYNPAFDVTPPHLVTALVTECGITQPMVRGNLRDQYGNPAAAPRGLPREAMRSSG